MIDFEKELKKFRFLDTDEDFIQLQNESSVLFKAFHSTLKRLSREQNQTNTQLEEVIGLAEESSDFRSERAAWKKKLSETEDRLSAAEEEKLTLIRGFLIILDQIEDLYRYTEKSGSESWSRQLGLLWNNISGQLLSIGITKISGENADYNKDLQTVAELRDCPDSEDGIVLQVLRCGYLYRSGVLRKAEVVVNKRENGDKDSYSYKDNRPKCDESSEKSRQSEYIQNIENNNKPESEETADNDRKNSGNKRRSQWDEKKRNDRKNCGDRSWHLNLGNRRIIRRKALCHTESSGRIHHSFRSRHIR